MHDPDETMRIVARALLGFMGVFAVFRTAAITLGTGERPRSQPALDSKESERQRLDVALAHD